MAELNTIDPHIRGEALAFLEASHGIENETIGTTNINSEFSLLYKGKLFHLFNIDLLGEPVVVAVAITEEEMAKPYAERKDFNAFQGSAYLIVEQIFPETQKIEISGEEVYTLPEGVTTNGRPVTNLTIGDNWQLEFESLEIVSENKIEQFPNVKKIGIPDSKILDAEKIRYAEKKAMDN